MARKPSKPTKIQTAAVAKARGCGLPWARAAWAAGISPPTLQMWRERGEAGEAPYDAFLESVEKARTEWIQERLGKIQAAGADTWQANAWLLERAEAQEFGRRIHEHQGKEGGPVEFVLNWQKPMGGDSGEDDPE